jgi:hypothetical protein
LRQGKALRSHSLIEFCKITVRWLSSSRLELRRGALIGFTFKGAAQIDLGKLTRTDHVLFERARATGRQASRRGRNGSLKLCT